MVPFLVLLPLVELDSANLMQVCAQIWEWQCCVGFGGGLLPTWPH